MSDPLLQALCNPALYPHPVQGFRVLETHISQVVLTGGHAYKIKKPVRFSFLDFTRLEDRRRYCEAELALNRRLSGDLYEAVVAITGTPEAPVLDGEGPAVEYAVRMREFPQEALLDAVQARGALAAEVMDTLARRIARFHMTTPEAPPDHPQCRTAALFHPVTENFRLIRPLLVDAEDRTRLDALERRAHDEFARLESRLAARIADGRIRECHGDLHLGNIALLDGEAVPFDCIEFNDAFRVIDVASDIAFLIMDLESRELPGLAARVLNGWLEETGDYDALGVIDFYKAYRALVRAKVNLLRLTQTEDPSVRTAVLAEYRRYAALADRCRPPAGRLLVITCGVSGSGKSRAGLRAVERLRAVRLRSDVERKRGLSAPGAASGIGAGLYAPDVTEVVYARLGELARRVLASGYPAVLDATFLKRQYRERAAALARDLGVPFAILACEAPRDLIVRRLTARRTEGKDPSDATPAVVDAQLAAREPLDPVTELPFSVPVDTAAEGAAERAAATLAARAS